MRRQILVNGCRVPCHYRPRLPALDADYRSHSINTEVDLQERSHYLSQGRKRSSSCERARGDFIGRFLHGKLVIFLPSPFTMNGSGREDSDGFFPSKDDSVGAR